MRSLAILSLSMLLLPAATNAQEPWEPVFRAGDLKIEATSYVQLDFRAYPNWEALDGFRNDAIELRRVRLGAEGEWKKLAFELDFDPGDPNQEYVKDAYLDVELAKAARVRGGHFKLPFSPELLRSPSKIDFIERAIAVDALGPRRDLGVMLHGELFERFRYQAGVFAGDGSTRFERAGRTTAARIEVEALDGFVVGASFTSGDVDAAPEDPGGIGEPKGFAGQSASGFEFFAPHFVGGTRRRLDLEAELVRGPVAVRGELLKGSEERRGQGALFDDLPDVEATGWYVSATWLVTGEKKRRTIRPDHPVPGGVGAVEVGVRLESLRFDDLGGASGSSFESASDRARNVRPAQDLIFTSGVSWWPSRFFRVMTNVLVDRYQDPLFAPESGRSGNYVSILTRFQFMLP
jgi:phosphate-selective porin